MTNANMSTNVANVNTYGANANMYGTNAMTYGTNTAAYGTNTNTCGMEGAQSANAPSFQPSAQNVASMASANAPITYGAPPLPAAPPTTYGAPPPAAAPITYGAPTQANSMAAAPPTMAQPQMSSGTASASYTMAPPQGAPGAYTQGVVPSQNMTYAAASTMGPPQGGSGTLVQGVAPAQNGNVAYSSSAVQQPSAQALFDQLDVNGDGQLSLHEFKSLQQFGAPQMTEQLATSNQTQISQPAVSSSQTNAYVSNTNMPGSTVSNA